MNIQRLVERLSGLDFVHTIILFGSQAKNLASTESDIDLCIIEPPNHPLSLQEKIQAQSAVSTEIDLSFFHDLPLDIRHRVFEEGQILYTKDMYYVLTLLKETDFDYPAYKRFEEEYHRSVMESIQAERGS